MRKHLFGALCITVLAGALPPAATAEARTDPGYRWGTVAWGPIHSKGGAVTARGTSWRYQYGIWNDRHLQGKIQVTKKGACGWIMIEAHEIGEYPRKFQAHACGAKPRSFDFVVVGERGILWATARVCEGTRAKPTGRCSRLTYLPGFRFTRKGIRVQKPR